MCLEIVGKSPVNANLNLEESTIEFEVDVDSSMSASSANPVQNKVVKLYVDNAIANLPEEQFLDLAKTEFVENFTWSNTTYPGSTNPNLNGKPVLVLALKDEDGNVAYSFINLEDLIDVYTGTSPITVSGNTISHANSGVTAGSVGPTANVTPRFGSTFNVPQVTVDSKGHVIYQSSRTVKMPNAIATQSADGLLSASDKEKLDGTYKVGRATGTIPATGTTVNIDMPNASCEPINVTAFPSGELDPVLIDWYPDGDGTVCCSISEAYGKSIFVQVFWMELEL